MIGVTAMQLCANRGEWLTATKQKLVRRRRQLHASCRRGAAVVEFAVVAPVLILLVFGLIEFGRAVMVQHVLVNASREGARQAVLDGSTVADVQSRIEEYLSASSIDGATVAYRVNGTVVEDPESAQFGDAIAVRVSVPFDNVSWLPVPAYLGKMTLTATSIMRREASQ